LICFVDHGYRESTPTLNENFIDINNTNINPVTIVHNQQTMTHFSSTEKNFCTNSPIIQICLVLFIVILIIILVILTGFYIHRSSRISQLEKELKIKNNSIAEEQMKNNLTIQTNKILNNKINALEKDDGKMNIII